MNDVFPRCYRVGVGLVALAAGVVRTVVGSVGVALAVVLAATAVGVVASASARWVLVPRMEAAFGRYHRRSVAPNVVTLVAVVVAFVASHL